MRRSSSRPDSTSAFTLAEVAVTLVIVGIALVFVLQGLSQAKLSSYYTTNRKIARQLALETLAEISSGLYREEIQPGGDRLLGSYAEEGYEAFEYEVLFGEEEDFSIRPHGLDRNQNSGFDSWSRSADDNNNGIPDNQESSSNSSNGSTGNSDDQDEEDAKEPYEVVRIQVVFPKVGLPDADNLIMLERWIPWEQVYGEDEEDSTSDSASETGSAAGTDPGGAS